MMQEHLDALAKGNMIRDIPDDERTVAVETDSAACTNKG